MKVADPNFVCKTKHGYQLQPPITHPPNCVCAICPRHRERFAADNGISIDKAWDATLVIRARRVSPKPNSHPESIAAALKLKETEEARLLAEVEAAREAKRAKQNARSFGDVTDAYRRYLISEGKEYSKAASRINNIEALVGRERDAYAIDITIHREVLAEVAQLSAQTRRHYGATLLAMMNNAKAEGIITHHPLNDLRLPTVKKSDAPVTWTRHEFAVITGPALDQWECEQAAWNRRVGRVEGTGSLRAPSHLPLRGLILVAYYTLMRPKNNRALTWEEVTLDPVKLRGTFRLNRHKNVNKGINAYGRLARELVEYLLAIRPRNAKGYIHPNPSSGKPYVDIRKQWDRLIAIASGMLGYPLVDEKADFFTFRHTGATHIAQMASNRFELMRVVNMMGDTNVETVRRHYFNFEDEDDEQVIDRWERPKLQPPASTPQSPVLGSDLTN